MKKVGTLVVTYNRLYLLKEAIDSLRSQTFKDMQIVVVNNGSTDGTKEWLEMQEDIYIITQENLGGAGGFFTGMKYIAEAGYEYCWLMDDDVECEPTALEELLKAIQIDENIGFVCSKIMDMEGKPNNVPDIDLRLTKNGYPFWYDKIEYQMVKIRVATFVSVLIPTKHIVELGLPYKEFFIWCDDTEYTKRITNKYNSYIACKSEVIHKRTQSGFIAFYLEKNQERLKFYFYKFRNASFIFNQEADFWQKMGRSFHYLLMFLKMCIKLDFKRANIILKSQFSLLFFRPHIQYPKKLINL